MTTSTDSETLAEIRAALGRIEHAHRLPRPLLTVDEVAELLRVSRRTVETLIGGGHLVPIRIGRQRRIHPDALDAYIRHQARRAA